jgi:NADH dehydrogenase
VVVGAGFGGFGVCEALASAEVDIVLVDRHNYNTFQPLLYQVATAGLNPGDIAYPVRAYARQHPSLRFRQDLVTRVDVTARRVSFADGPPLEYDYLVLAAGAGTTYFGVPGAKENSKAIYTMEDAVAVRDAVAGGVERAAAHGARPGDLTVVIVGGGPTGVEMAGALAELRQMEFATHYTEIDPSMSRIVLVETQDRLLGAFHPKLSSYALGELRRRGVEVRCGERVKEVQAGRAVLGSGDAIDCGLVIWAAGVGPCQLTDVLDLPKVHGRIQVGGDLRVPGFDDVFAIGDMAAASGGRDGDGSVGPVLPQLAQPAIQEGRHAGEQIRHLLAGEPTVPFHYRDKGTLATIGRRAAVAELPFRIRLRGTPAWLVWLGLHIVFLVGVRNRTSVLLNWAWRYVSWGRGPRVIAGG